MTTPPHEGLGAIMLLRDGSVMAHNEDVVIAPSGSFTERWWRLRPNIINGTLDYVGATWQPTGPLPSGYRPSRFGSAVLPDGRLIIEGGEYCNSTGDNCNIKQGAVYDPRPNFESWSLVPQPGDWSYIGGASSVLLPDGVYM
jgi:hypothetical protein